MHISIVGCGSLGSWIAYGLIRKNIKLNFYSCINIIDYDIIQENNLPFLNINSRNILDKPKVYVLKEIVEKEFKNNFQINYFNSKYEDISLHNDSIFIDCRDTNMEDKKFKLKFNIDGSICKMVKAPNEMFNDFKELNEFIDTSYIIKGCNVQQTINKFYVYIIHNCLFNTQMVNYNGCRRERIISL